MGSYDWLKVTYALFWSNAAMEDAHAIELSLDSTSDEENAFFAVYDGHGGTSILYSY